MTLDLEIIFAESEMGSLVEQEMAEVDPVEFYNLAIEWWMEYEMERGLRYPDLG